MYYIKVVLQKFVSFVTCHFNNKVVKYFFCEILDLRTFLSLKKNSFQA